MNIGEYFGFLIVIGVVQFSTTFIIPKENDKLEEFRFSKHDLKRFRREKCETLLYYDVSCHGLCPYTEKDWEKNKIYMNCTDGLVYHCARDNATNKYVEACAEAVWCDRGKEPRLIFPPGHNKKARVICRYCHDEDFYNPIEFRLSSTYYECTEYKIPCSRYGIGKIRCDEDGFERHWKDNKCRCNEGNMYIESNAACPTDFPCKNKTNFDFTCELYDCGKTSDGYWRNLTKDYCCACEDGYIRNETSNKCHKSSHVVSSQTMNISHDHTKTVMATVMMSYKVEIDISASTNSTTHRNTISYIQPTVTARPSGGPDNKYTITIVVLALVILIFIVGIVCYNRKKIYKKKGHGEPFDSPQIKKLLRETSLPNNQHASGSVQPQSVSSASDQETSLPNNQHASGSVQPQSVSSASDQGTSLPNNQNAGASVPSAPVKDPSSANNQNGASFAQPLTNQSEESCLPKSRNAGGSAQLPSDSSASVQDSTTVTTKDTTSTDIFKLIIEIDDIEEQQKQAIFKRLEDKRTKEIADLKKLRQQEGSSAVQNAAGIDYLPIDSVCSQEWSSANNKSVHGSAQLSKTTAPLNTDSEGSSAVQIQNAADIVLLRSDSVCSQANNQNEAGFAQRPSPTQPFINQNEDSSLPNNQNEAVSAQLPPITENDDSSLANYGNGAGSAQLPRTPDPFLTQSEEPSSANNHNEAGSAQIPIPRISVLPESEGSDTKHAIPKTVSLNRNNKR